MHINIREIVVICIVAGLFWWANDSLNRVPFLKQVIQVVIIVTSVLFLLQGLGLIDGTNVTVNS